MSVQNKVYFDIKFNLTIFIFRKHSKTGQSNESNCQAWPGCSVFQGRKIHYRNNDCPISPVEKKEADLKIHDRNMNIFWLLTVVGALIAESLESQLHNPVRKIENRIRTRRSYSDIENSG